MNVWKTLGLLVVFGLLLAWSMKYERGEKPDFEADRTVVQLLGFKQADDIVEVTVQGDLGPFTLRKQEPPAADQAAKDAPKPEPVWEITAPTKSKGDSTSIASYVKALLTAKVQKAYGAEDAKRLPDTESGLDKPLKSLAVKDASGRAGTLHIGHQTPDKSGYFARVQGSSDLLVFATYFCEEDIAKKKVGDLRDKTLLAFLTSDVKKVALKYPARTITLEKQGEDWQIAGASGWKADPSAVDSLLSALSSARIEEFGESKPTALQLYGLDQPRVEVTLSLGDKGEQGLVVGTTKAADTPAPADPNTPPPAEKLYVQRKGDTEVLLVPGTLYDSLVKQELDLRDKTVVKLHPEDVTKLEYTKDGQTVVLEKTRAAKDSQDSKTIWQLAAPQKLPADRKVADGLVSTLDQLRATGFVDQPKDLKAYGLATPRARIVATEAGKALPALLVGKAKADGSSVFVLREGDPKVVYEVRASFIDDFVTDPNRLRNLLVLEVDRTKVQRIALRQKDGTLAVVKSTGADTWEIERAAEKDAQGKVTREAETKPADAGRVAAVLTTLSELHASLYVADQAADLKQYGLDNPDVTATVTLAGGAKETIYIAQDPQDPQAAYLKRKGQAAIYRNDKDLTLLDLRKRPEDFEPVEQPPMDMMNMGGAPPM